MDLLLHDVRYIWRSIPMVKDVTFSSKSMTFADYWEKSYQKYPTKTALVFAENGQCFSFNQVNTIANQIACFLLESDYFRNSETIALMMENRPEYIFSLLAIAKLGKTIAFINPNANYATLKHALSVLPNCKFLIYGSEIEANVNSVSKWLEESTITTLCVDKYTDITNQNLNESISDSAFKSYRENLGTESIYGYIYTSGTTGLPKACIIRNKKFVLICSWLKNFFSITTNDIHYCALPLYHTAGGILGLSSMIYNGQTLVLARKFSATQFFVDCHKYRCTTSQYIGEICRYLVAKKPQDVDKSHQLRLMFGNGLRRDIWLEFISRFKIQQIGEFYGSTEGNASLCQLYTNNISPAQAIGACGRIGPLLEKSMNIAIVQYDKENEKPVRGPDGYCRKVLSNEVGELIGKISSTGIGSGYDGYTGSEETSSKILRNVFSAGDLYFRTGDLIKKSGDGWIYFVDRIGDTFRWKGENVSTTEVSDVLSEYKGIEEVTTYGVPIPRQDGKACMVAIVKNDSFDLNAFTSHVEEKLPKYSRPKFIRFMNNLCHTGTFKQKKVELVSDGFDPKLVDDPMFYFCSKSKSYNELAQKDYETIVIGNSRL